MRVTEAREKKDRVSGVQHTVIDLEAVKVEATSDTETPMRYPQAIQLRVTRATKDECWVVATCESNDADVEAYFYGELMPWIGEVYPRSGLLVLTIPNDDPSSEHVERAGIEAGHPTTPTTSASPEEVTTESLSREQIAEIKYSEGKTDGEIAIAAGYSPNYRKWVIKWRKAHGYEPNFPRGHWPKRPTRSG